MRRWNPCLPGVVEAPITATLRASKKWRTRFVQAMFCPKRSRVVRLATRLDGCKERVWTAARAWFATGIAAVATCSRLHWPAEHGLRETGAMIFYVRNLPPDVAESEIRRVFEPIGVIESGTPISSAFGLMG